MTKKIKRIDQYWICHECAIKKNWKVVPYPITCIEGLCGHCDREDKTTLIPMTDFDKPGKKAIWD